MKQRIVLLSLLILLAFIPLRAVSAIGPLDDVCANAGSSTNKDASPTSPAVCTENASNTGQDPLTGTGGILLRAGNILAVITGMASVIILILGSIKYIISGGDANAIESAKNTIVYALIGLIVAVLARSIIVFVINKLR